MVNQWTLKLLLLPLAILYGIGVAIRNGLFSIGLLRGVTFSLPVISVGNLTVGAVSYTHLVLYYTFTLYENYRPELNIKTDGTTSTASFNLSTRAETRCKFVDLVTNTVLLSRISPIQLSLIHIYCVPSISGIMMSVMMRSGN